MADISPKLVRMVAEAKEAALRLLREVGIEDDFLVRIKTLRRKQSGWIALYRARTQFRGWRRPIFWIASDIERKVVECELELDLAYGTREQQCGHIEQEVFRTIVDSLLHEYGHVIWEFATLQPATLLPARLQHISTQPAHPELKTLVERYAVEAEGGEEVFAEDFMKLCRDDEHFMDGNPELMRQIALQYMQELREHSE